MACKWVGDREKQAQQLAVGLKTEKNKTLLTETPKLALLFLVFPLLSLSPSLPAHPMQYALVPPQTSFISAPPGTSHALRKPRLLARTRVFARRSSPARPPYSCSSRCPEVVALPAAQAPFDLAHWPEQKAAGALTLFLPYPSMKFEEGGVHKLFISQPVSPDPASGST